MSLFFYRARDPQNQAREGTVDAISLQHARDLLKSKELFVEHMHEATPSLLSQPSSPSLPHYYPLIDTLRLYAGWLLAWYSVVFAIGAYQSRGTLPFHSDLIAGLASSITVLSLAFATFLFLMLSSLHRLIHGGILKGFLLTLLGTIAEIWFVVNI